MRPYGLPNVSLSGSRNVWRVLDGSTSGRGLVSELVMLRQPVLLACTSAEISDRAVLVVIDKRERDRKDDCVAELVHGWPRVSWWVLVEVVHGVVDAAIGLELHADPSCSRPELLPSTYRCIFASR